MKILEVHNLVKTFKDPNNNNFKVLDDITLSLNKGEVLGLVGESGSGKTTLGRTIIRLTNQDSGNIIFDNIDISNLSKSVMKKIRKDLNCKLIRGNVETRIKKLNDNLYDAIILSSAGINSLGMTKKISQIFTITVLSFLTFGCLDKSVKFEEKSSWQVVEGFK